MFNKHCKNCILNEFVAYQFLSRRDHLDEFVEILTNNTATCISTSFTIPRYIATQGLRASIHPHKVFILSQAPLSKQPALLTLPANFLFLWYMINGSKKRHISNNSQHKTSRPVFHRAPRTDSPFGNRRAYNNFNNLTNLKL